MDDLPNGESNTTPDRGAICQLCHRRVPEREIVFMGGRQLCFGCAAAWFDEDEEDE